MRRRVLRAHVDDDALLALVGDAGDDGVPVLAGDGEDPALGGLRLGGAVRVAVAVALSVVVMQYALRLSGGGIVAPLYSTGMPPSG